MWTEPESRTPWVVTLYGLQLKVVEGKKKLMVGLIDKGHADSHQTYAA